jgi:hypothetical protein
MKKSKKHTLLKGEGVHQHTLYGDLLIGEQEEFTELKVKKDSDLIHEKPNGDTGEHKTLRIEKGDWIMGKQVEYNPFNRQVSRIWD